VGEESSISAIWRGEPFPKNVLLLDNDFFSQLGTAHPRNPGRRVQGVL
jgi:hypothetical protein